MGFRAVSELRKKKIVDESMRKVGPGYYNPQNLTQIKPRPGYYDYFT